MKFAAVTSLIFKIKVLICQIKNQSFTSIQVVFVLETYTPDTQKLTDRILILVVPDS